MVIICSFVGSIVNLCNCCYSIPPASRARSNVHEALGSAFPKRRHVDCGVFAIICKVPILGRYSTNLKAPSYASSNPWIHSKNSALLQKYSHSDLRGALPSGTYSFRGKGFGSNT
jgi:hypothetical protein